MRLNEIWPTKPIISSCHLYSFISIWAVIFPSKESSTFVFKRCGTLNRIYFFLSKFALFLCHSRTYRPTYLVCITSWMDKTQGNYGSSSIVQNMDAHVVRHTGLFMKDLFYLFCLSQFSKAQRKFGRAQCNVKHFHTFQLNSPVIYYSMQTMCLYHHSRIQIQEYNTLEYVLEVELSTYFQEHSVS